MATDRPHVTDQRSLDAVLMKFDFHALLAQLKAEPTWTRESHNAMTILKSDRLRIVIVAMHAGSSIPSHQASTPISVQVVEGSIELCADSHTTTLTTGQLLTLQARVPHSLRALGESAFLLTLAAGAPHPAEE